MRFEMRTPVSRLPSPVSLMLFNNNLQWHSYNLLLMPELAPNLVATRLRKRVYKANIRAIDNTGGQDAAGCHWADRMDMRENSSGGIASDHVAGHAQPGLHIADGHAATAEAERERSLL